MLIYKHIHILSACRKCYCVFNQLFRIFRTKSISSLILAIKLYCIPLIEYANSVRCPVSIKKYLSNLDRLEIIQRYFTRRLYFRCNGYVKRYSPNYISYTQRLTLYNLEPLELRRLKLDLVMIFKLANNHIAVNSEKFLIIPIHY